MNLRTLSLSCLVAIAGCSAGASPELTPRVAPRSLAGTAIDGELRTGPDGAFVFDERARQAFDYFLTADQELGPDELDAWVRGELARALPAPAVDDAHAAWQAYLGFRSEAAATLSGPVDDLAAAERTLLRAVDEHLGDYPIAADERTGITHGFARKRIDALTGEAREQALAELAEPGDISDAEQLLAARQAIGAAQLAGATDLQALRSEHFGPAAAARLAALDEQRAAWSRRVAEHRDAREALRARLAGPDLDAAVAELEAQDFSPAEQRRLHALDRLTTR